MGTRNPILSTKIKGLNYDLANWKNVKFSLMDDLSEALLLRDFFNSILKNGDVQGAIDKLPKDNDKTEYDESVSVDDLRKICEKLGMEFPEDIEDLEDLNEELNSEFSELAKEVKAKIRNIYGKMRSADMSADDVDREIKDLKTIQQEDGKEI